MKSNLRRKLFMSLAATAACAATLTSTTFAWYTSNTTVEASQVVGQTSATADSSSIFIATAQSYSGHQAASWSTYGAKGDIVYTENTTGGIVLAPVWYDTANNTVIAGTAATYKATTDTNAVEGKDYYTRSGIEGSYTYTKDETITTGTTVTGKYEIDTPATAAVTDMKGSFKKLTGETKDPTEYTYAETIPNETEKIEDAESGTYPNWPTNKYYKLTSGTAGTDEATYELVASYDSSVQKYYVANPKAATYTMNYGNASNVKYTDAGNTYTADYVEFIIRLRTANVSASGTKIYLSKFELVNTADTLPTQTALTYGTGTGIKAAGKYSADLMKALKMNVWATDITVNKETNAETRGTEGAADVYALSAFAKENSDINIDDAGADAVGYFNKVMGRNAKKPTTGYSEGYEVVKAAKKDTPLCTISTSGYVELRFAIYLDGWDSYCYDVMMQQGFKLDMKFSTSDQENVLQLKNVA